MTDEPVLVCAPDDVVRIAARCSAADRVAVDVESNGLFKYRPALCTLQLAWSENGRMEVAIIDTLATGVGPLAAMLGPGGPTKVLHDLTFDAKLLAEFGAPLGRVRDTSVAARFLGFAATGLASMLVATLGINHDKRFQQNDWTRRPITAPELAYLAGDVLHLLALDDHLQAMAAAVDIGREIDAECAHKLATADAPPRDGRPGYVRIKGSAALDAVGRAVLRRLCLLREQAAEAANVPPFKVVGNDTLLALAAKRPLSARDVRAVRGAGVGRASGLTGAFVTAITAGLRDGDIPDEDRPLFEPPRVDRALLARRRARDAQITAWRKAEAKRRGVDEQAILPGHCAQDLVDALLAHTAGDPALPTAIARVAGLGTRRLELYGDAFLALAADDPALRPPRAVTGTAPACEQDPSGDDSPA